VNEFFRAEDTNGEDRETAPETRAKTPPPPQGPLSLTFTRHKGGGFIGKQLIGPGGKFQTICAGKDFIDEAVACKDFDHVAAMIAERAQDGEWAISLGTPARDPSGPHSHEAADYLDTPTRLFFVDADGVFAKGLGSARKFAAAAKHVVSLMGEAFKSAAYLALRTTRTGSDKNRVFIRFLFLLRTPTTLAQMGAVAKGLNELPAFKLRGVAPHKTTIDLRLYKEGHFVFIASPQCAPGMIDAASSVAPVKVEGDALDLNEAAKALGIDLANVSAKRWATRAPGVTASDKRRVSPIAPGTKNQELLTALVRSIRNDGKFDNRDRTGAATGEGSYIGMAYALFGACSNEPPEFGRGLWLEWAASWHRGGDPAEDERVWDTLDPNGVNGFWDLMDYARAFGGPEGLKMRGTIYKELLPDISDEQLDSLASTHIGDIPDWVGGMNTKYAYIQDRPGGVLVRDGGERRVVKMLKVSEFKLLFANKEVVIGRNKDGSAKKRNMADTWLRHPARAEYRTADNYPAGRQPPGALNLWTRLAVAPRHGKWPLLEAFLLEIICDNNQKAFDCLLKTIQWKIQNPIINPEVGIILRGAPGTGKGTFARMFKVIFGEKRFHRYGKPSAAAGRFNVTAENRIVLFYDESFFGHDKQAKGMIKGDVSDHDLEIEPKGIDSYTVKNIALRIFASNEGVALPIDINDRRFLVLDVSKAHAKDIAYFTALNAAIDGDEMAAFVDDALATDLTAFEAVRREPYKTKARAELAAAGASPEQEYLFLLLAQGGSVATSFGWNARPVGQLRPDPNDPWRTGPVAVAVDAIQADYLQFLKERHRGSPQRNFDELETIIRDALGVALFHSHQIRVPGAHHRRERMRLFGSLNDCRAAYDKYTEHTHEWDDNPGTAGTAHAVLHHIGPDGRAYDIDGNELI
jgi:hypothetical protein